jgi:hypothetical protein
MVDGIEAAMVWPEELAEGLLPLLLEQLQLEGTVGCIVRVVALLGWQSLPVTLDAMSRAGPSTRIGAQRSLAGHRDIPSAWQAPARRQRYNDMLLLAMINAFVGVEVERHSLPP